MTEPAINLTKLTSGSSGHMNAHGLVSVAEPARGGGNRSLQVEGLIAMAIPEANSSASMPFLKSSAGSTKRSCCGKCHAVEAHVATLESEYQDKQASVH